MDYIDGKFTEPKFLKEYGATVISDLGLESFFLTPGIVDRLRDTYKELFGVDNYVRKKFSTKH